MDKAMIDEKVCAIFGDINDAEEGTTFIDSPKEAIQFAVLRGNKGKVFQNHIHKFRPRVIKRTQESLFVVRGKVKAIIFDEDKNKIDVQIMVAGQFAIFYRGGHGFEILEDDTVIIENKPGDFIGVDEDKEKF